MCSMDIYDFTSAVIYLGFTRHVYDMVRIDPCTFSAGALARPDGEKSIEDEESIESESAIA